VSDIPRSVAFYRDKVGLALRHQEEAFAILTRDDVELHLWRANDDRWQARGGPRRVVSGAESFLAGTGSCRLRAAGIDELYRRFKPLGILFAEGSLTETSWGDREFHIADPDGNLVTVFEPRRVPR